MCKLLKWRKESCDSSYCDAFWSLWWECTKKWWECCCTCWEGKIAFLFRKNNIKAGSWASLLERELFGSVPILLRKKWQLAVLSLAEDTAWWSAFLFLEYYGRWCLVSVSKLFMNLVLSIAIDQTQLNLTIPIAKWLAFPMRPTGYSYCANIEFDNIAVTIQRSVRYNVFF